MIRPHIREPVGGVFLFPEVPPPRLLALSRHRIGIVGRDVDRTVWIGIVEFVGGNEETAGGVGGPCRVLGFLETGKGSGTDGEDVNRTSYTTAAAAACFCAVTAPGIMVAWIESGYN